MERSSELRNLVLAFYDAASKGDVASLEGLFSHGSELLVIGADPGDWWTSRASVMRAFRAQMAELGGTMPIADSNPRAYCDHGIGWAVDRAKIVLPDGRKVPFRFTAVFREEGDGWKIVHQHFSIGAEYEPTADEPHPL